MMAELYCAIGLSCDPSPRFIVGGSQPGRFMSCRSYQIRDRRGGSGVGLGGGPCGRPPRGEHRGRPQGPPPHIHASPTPTIYDHSSAIHHIPVSSHAASASAVSSSWERALPSAHHVCHVVSSTC